MKCKTEQHKSRGNPIRPAENSIVPNNNWPRTITRTLFQLMEIPCLVTPALEGLSDSLGSEHRLERYRGTTELIGP